jgi:hypothetical protein
MTGDDEYLKYYKVIIDKGIQKRVILLLLHLSSGLSLTRSGSWFAFLVARAIC